MENKDFYAKMESELNVIENKKQEIETYNRENEIEIDEETLQEKIFEAIENDILSVDIRKTYDILLSFGGPSDGFKVICDEHNNLIEVKYWFADWGYYKEQKLDEEEYSKFIEIYEGTLISFDIREY